MIWLGNFNRHHESWEPHTNSHLASSADKIEPLLELLYGYGMAMALPPELPTLQACTGNWTRPNNVWITPNSDNLILSCNVHPELRPAGADHLPILIELDLTVPRSVAKPTRNFRTADLTKYAPLSKPT